MRLVKTIGILTLAFASQAVASPVSLLWGVSGEKWKPDSRLPDFSHAGGVAIQTAGSAISSVKDFGALGDGVTDDTAAFQKAVAEAPAGILEIPAGRYVLNGPIRVTRSGLILRGAGSNRTTLVCPRPLSEVEPLAQTAPNKARYSFTGGFIVLRGTDEGSKVADVVAAAHRGENALTLSSTGGLKVGDWVRLEMRDSDGSLGRHMHADLVDASETTRRELQPLVSWVAAVRDIKGDQVILDRPLRLDVRPGWKPALFACQPSLRDSGVEGLAFEFPGVPKKKHLMEDGYNAIHLFGAFNCRVKDIKIIDADNGIIVGGLSRFCTVEDIKVVASKRKDPTGHHALWATMGSQDCLFSNFQITTRYVHDLSVEGRANGNVFSGGSGVSLNFDHHRNAPYENLFTDLKVGDPRRVWDSGGSKDRGPHSAARATFWNISGDRQLPAVPAWPQANFIGLNATKSKNQAEIWLESPEPVVPENLYEAQRARATKP